MTMRNLLLHFLSLASVLTLAAASLTACGDKDNPAGDSSATDTLRLAIAYDASEVTLSGDVKRLDITQENAHVIISSAAKNYLEITVSGTSEDASLTVYRSHKWGLKFNGVNLTNPFGPVVNNQSTKSLFVDCCNGTVNTLTDGSHYANPPINAAGQQIDQKGVFFSEGQLYLRGNGSLIVNGNAKNGIASDDYIVLEGGNISVNMAATATNGLKANDGVFLRGGTLAVSVKGAGARGIRCDSTVVVEGGETTITTEGGCKIAIDASTSQPDTTSAAGIKCNGKFTMSAGTLTITSTGDGGKGINSVDSVVVTGGTISVTTTGTNVNAKPKGVKSDRIIILSGGAFHSKVKKSKACESGADEWPVVIDPTKWVKQSKREVEVIY